MKTKVIAYKGLSCSDQCREWMRVPSHMTAIFVFILLELVLAPLISGDFFLDLPVRNLYGYEIRTLAALAVGAVAYAFSARCFSKDCPACREEIRESNLPGKKIQWFGYF